MSEYFKANFASIDLEMNQPSGKIIQIGIAIGSYLNDDPIESISIIVNPNEILDPYIIGLTGITQEQVDKGVSLISAYNEMLAYLRDKNLFINPVTWGGGDSIQLKEELMKTYPELDMVDWPFGRRWIDAKTEYVGFRVANGLQPTGGLSKAMTKVGLNFKGRKHNAKDDAINTLRMWRKLISMKKLDCEYNDSVSDLCSTCDGSGGVDSGGVTPWMEAIVVPCPECKAKGKLE